MSAPDLDVKGQGQEGGRWTMNLRVSSQWERELTSGQVKVERSGINICADQQGMGWDSCLWMPPACIWSCSPKHEDPLSEGISERA